MGPTFIDYLYLRRHEKSAVGDLARDMIHDRDQCPLTERNGPCEWDEPNDLPSLVACLVDHGACEGAMNAAAFAWADYQRWLGHTNSYASIAA